jgi:hypothetical protein
MLETLKSLWSRWRVQVSFVGGALVVATAYGTCSYDPQTVSEAQVEPASGATGDSETTTVPVSSTTAAGSTESSTGTSTTEGGTTSEGTTGTETTASE